MAFLILAALLGVVTLYFLLRRFSGQSNREL